MYHIYIKFIDKFKNYTILPELINEYIKYNVIS